MSDRFTPLMPLPPFPPKPGWVEGAPVIPDIYWNNYSAEQRWKAICIWLHKLTEFINTQEIPEIDHLQSAIEALEDAFEKFQESGFEDYYAEQIRDWINNNLPWLWKTFAKQVFFGLTDDGHFCAYVPESWSDIQFDTGAVYGRSDYGRLILKFEPDPNAHGVIDNTYSNYTLNANQQTMQQLIADLESTTRRSDATYNAMFSNLDEEVNNGNF